MRVTLTWLQELVEVSLSAGGLAEVLTAAGLEVEGIEEHRPVWRGVEIAEVLDVEAHPNADRLRLCRVRTGSGLTAIVCGASNMRAGDRVALAVPGTELPGGRRIERSTIRGVASEGMLCAAEELALDPAGAAGIMILPPDAPLGTPLVDYLGAEDTVLEIGITPNRGDCLSMLGIAREVAALTGARLRARKPAFREETTAARTLAEVAVEAADLCPRYCARVVRDVAVGPAPARMRTRLAMVGLRPINNVVDATNYVMLELGQPLHAFDRSLLQEGRIVVRRAGAATRFATLDGAVHELVPDDLVIADGRGPVALAGIMGGANSEIREGTTEVLLESAFFTPATVRRTARRLGVSTESSYRFERGVDPSGTAAALDRLAELLVVSAGGRVARGVVERRARTRWVGRPIRLRAERANALLGTALSPARMGRALTALGAQVQTAGRSVLRVVPPAHRFDLQEEIDLVEEVARLTGYDAVAATIPAVAAGEAREDDGRGRERSVREALRAVGLDEMVTLAMVAPEDNRDYPGLAAAGERAVALANPLSSEAAEMRRSLIPGLLRALAENRRQGEPVVAGFTLGRVYGARAEGYVERTQVAIVVAGTWPPPAIGAQARAADFADVKGALESLCRALHVEGVRWEVAGAEAGHLHPGKAARMVVAGTVFGVAGALHPDRSERLGLDVEPWLAELDLQNLVQYCPRRVIFRPLPRFPAVQRDVAVVVDAGFQAQQVLDAIDELAQPLLEEVRVFDQYTGEPIPPGKKSLAYAVSYRAPDRTLTDDEVNALHQGLVDTLVRRLPLEVRR